MFGDVYMLNLKMLEGMGKTQVLCTSREQAEEFCQEMWRQYPNRMTPAWFKDQTNWHPDTLEKWYLPRIDVVNGEVDFCQSSDRKQHGYQVITFDDLKFNPDFGEIIPSEMEIKRLFGMG